MKLIIDISEDVRIAIEQMGLLRIPDAMQKKVDKAIQHGTPIPDNATNVDVIKAMFPDDIWLQLYARRAKNGWWNALYQKGGKE